MSRPEGPMALAPHFLCVGYSHVATVQKGAAELGIPIETLNFWKNPETIVNFWNLPEGVESDDGSSLFSSETGDRLRAHVGPVCALVAGTAHLVVGTLVHPRAFDFVLPSEPELELKADAEVLPSLAVRRILEKISAPFIAQLAEMASLCDGPFFHFEPPPPTFDSRAIEKHVPWTWFPGMLHEVAPPIFRYKLWRLHSEIVAAACLRLGVQFVPAPATSKDERGFLHDRFFEDGTHGNLDYGKLMVKQIEERI